MGSSLGVHLLLVPFAFSAVTALYDLGSAASTVPVAAIVAVASHCYSETLLFERWQKAPVAEMIIERNLGMAASGKEPANLRACSTWREG